MTLSHDSRNFNLNVKKESIMAGDMGIAAGLGRDIKEEVPYDNNHSLKSHDVRVLLYPVQVILKRQARRDSKTVNKSMQRGFRHIFLI